jgi:hypothetical protein
MKNLYKLIAIIALVAVIGFSMTGCKDDPEPAHTHTWGAWQETTVPTCTTAGIKTRTCTVCGAADTQTQEGTAALGHDWNANAETITTNAAATETENSIRAVKCKRDSTHLKDEVIEYAIGTAGLEYTLITTGDYANTYQVSRGTFDGAVLHIPAYHREPTDVDYIPVTTIRGIGDTDYNNIITTLTTVTFAAENQLKIIGIDAIRYCSGLTSITIPDSVTYIGGYAFLGCTSLTNIIIPASVTSIDIAVFYGCTSLASITIPNSVTSIGQQAFSGCASLTSITIPASVTTIGQNVFISWTDTQAINVPFANADAKPAGWNANWNQNCNAVIKYWNGTTWE